MKPLGRLVVWCGCVAFALAWGGGMVAFGQVPGAPPDNSDLLSKPQYTESLQSLEQQFRFYVPPSERGRAYLKQCEVDAMLFLRTMRTLPSIRPPYLYSFVVSAAPPKARSLQMKWIGTDQSIPKFEIIGRGGQVVGSFAGVPKYNDTFGQRSDWFRRLLLFPILKGEKDIGEHFSEKTVGMEIRLDVINLREIEGMRLVPGDNSLPRFVLASFGDSVFASSGSPPDPPEPQRNSPGTSPPVPDFRR